jgi:hypothetical protein
LVGFFQKGEHILRIISKWAESSTLGDGDHEQFDNRFVPVLEEFPLIVLVMMFSFSLKMIMAQESRDYYIMFKYGW